MTLATFVCGGPVGGNTSSLVIPITADVPRSDAALGATIVLIFLSWNGPANLLSVTDDATPEDGYSFCLFEDGLNHYATDSTVLPGLIANDLTNGVHNITITLDGVAPWITAAAIAVTGVNLPASGPAPLFTPPLTGFLTSLAQQAEAPVGGGGSVALGIGYTIDAADVISFIGPITATDTDWDWVNGELAFYFLRGTATSDHLGWTWSDAAITDLLQWDVPEGGSGFFAQAAIGLQSVTPGAAGPSVNGIWGDGSTGPLSGNGFALISGPGPGPCSTPPVFGNPCFNRVVPV